MVVAANTIKGGGTIAHAKPYLADRIAKEILKVQVAVYETRECENVAIGQAIDAFCGFFELIKRKGPVREFVADQITNTRHTVRKKAEKFIMKYDTTRTTTGRKPGGKKKLNRPRTRSRRTRGQIHLLF
jgi:hypothetical protein